MPSGTEQDLKRFQKHSNRKNSPSADDGAGQGNCSKQGQTLFCCQIVVNMDAGAFVVGIAADIVVDADRLHMYQKSEYQSVCVLLTQLAITVAHSVLLLFPICTNHLEDSKCQLSSGCVAVCPSLQRVQR